MKKELRETLSIIIKNQELIMQHLKINKEADKKPSVPAKVKKSPAKKIKK